MIPLSTCCSQCLSLRQNAASHLAKHIGISSPVQPNSSTIRPLSRSYKNSSLNCPSRIKRANGVPNGSFGLVRMQLHAPVSHYASHRFVILFYKFRPTDLNTSPTPNCTSAPYQRPHVSDLLSQWLQKAKNHKKRLPHAPNAKVASLASVNRQASRVKPHDPISTVELICNLL